MKDPSRTINGICAQVGVNPTEFNEVLRRIRRVVLDENAQVISKIIGTFYRRDNKATTKTLNGIVYDVPASSCVQLRANKVVDGSPTCVEPALSGTFGVLQEGVPVLLTGSLPSFEIGYSFGAFMEVENEGDIAAATRRQGVRSNSTIAFGSKDLSSIVVTGVGGVFDVINGGVNFGYSDHPQFDVSVGDTFGLTIEVVGEMSEGLVECRVNRVINGSVSLSTVERYRPCDLEITFSFLETESLNDDEGDVIPNPFPKAPNYSLVV